MFNDNFKKFRKLAGMTQEDVANFLMVTPQAVSKWETGNGTPDISLLVPIAELFGISTDELLENTAKTDSFIAETDCMSYEERYSKYQILLKYNPTNAEILLKLLSISTEWLHAERSTLSKEKKNQIVSSAEDYSERLRSKSDKVNTWTESHGIMSDVYASAENFAAAKKEAEYLPSARYTHARIAGNIAHREKEYEKSRDFYRKSVIDTLTYLFWDIERIAGTYNPATNRPMIDKIYQTEYDIIRAIGDDHPVILHHLCNASIRLAQRAVWDKDHERAFELLDEFVAAAKILRCGNIDNTSEYSPIVSDDRATVKPISKELILCRLAWNAFNPIRKDPRFEKYIEEVNSWD
ncbi:MAG: helix-turn-helix domain-containing protein [Clostridia bacterium]|nr:helix-turn-helix domain-containing protein [Clostridia bacterium]